MQVLLKVFKFLPWVDLDLFHTKVKFGVIGICMGEVKIIIFLKLFQYLVSELLEAFN